jgi:hypothetical protein
MASSCLGARVLTKSSNSDIRVLENEYCSWDYMKRLLLLLLLLIAIEFVTRWQYKKKQVRKHT